MEERNLETAKVKNTPYEGAEDLSRKEKGSVGQILGLTSGLVRKKTHTVEEAAAE